MLLPIHWKLYLSGAMAVDASHQQLTERIINTWEFSRSKRCATALRNMEFVQIDQAVAAALILSSSQLSSSVEASCAPVWRSTSLAQSVFAPSVQATYTSTPRLPS